MGILEEQIYSLLSPRRDQWDLYFAHQAANLEDEKYLKYKEEKGRLELKKIL